MGKSKFGNNMKKIGEILPSVLSRMGIIKGIEQGKAVVFWENIVGNDIARHAKPFKVRKGILYVEVTSSVWVHELQMMEPEIRKRINKYLEKNIINKIRFYPARSSRLFKKIDTKETKIAPKVNKLSEKKEKTQKTIKLSEKTDTVSKTKKLSENQKKEIDKISSQIPDEDLKEHFEKAMESQVKIENTNK